MIQKWNVISKKTVYHYIRTKSVIENKCNKRILNIWKINSNNYKRYNFDNIDIKKHKRIFIVKIKMKQFNAIKMQYDVNLESIIKRKIKTILRSFFI